jgi:hypothetical protein
MSDDDAGRLEQVARTVTPGVRGRRNSEMDAFAWITFVGVLFFLLPLLPVIAVVWGLSKLYEVLAGRGGEAE